jgi:pre-mRNA-splicing helicase BRR2
VVSRRWPQQKNEQNRLFIADEVQMVGGEVGPTYEVVISQTQYVKQQKGNKTRIVACGVSPPNTEDLEKWMGASEHMIFNFSPRQVESLTSGNLTQFILSARPLIHIQSTSHP